MNVSLCELEKLQIAIIKCFLLLKTVLVSDKHVPCRALATLPTTYLSIGKSLTNPSGMFKSFNFYSFCFKNLLTLSPEP